MLLAFLEGGEVNFQVARLARAVDHADRVAAKGRHVVDRQVGHQRLDRPGQGGPVQTQGGGELVGTEVNRLAETAPNQALQAQQHRPLHVGLRAEPIDQAGACAGLVGLDVESDDRHVLARQELLDRPELVEDLENRADGRLVQVQPRRLADLGVGQLDRVVRVLSQELVDLVDRATRRILVLDEQFLKEAVGEGIEQEADRGEAVAPARPAS